MSFLSVYILSTILASIEKMQLSSTIAQTKSNGFTLAIVVMVGMVAALVYVVVAFLRGVDEDKPQKYSTVINLAVPVLTLIGLIVAAYLSYIEISSVNAICGPVGDCNAVQSSPYARLFGVLPIGVLGALGYLGILAAWLWGKFRSDRLSKMMPMVIFGMALFGVVFSLYLTYLEPFVIKAVCIWCISSAVIITILMLLSVNQALRVFEVKDTNE
jgi:uncharacterized membrane protein